MIKMGEIYTTERPLISQVIVLNGKRLSFGIWQNGLGEVVAKTTLFTEDPKAPWKTLAVSRSCKTSKGYEPRTAEDHYTKVIL